MTAMRYAVLGMLLLFALGDGCSPPPNVVGVQDYGQVTGRVLDAMTNRPIPNALRFGRLALHGARRRQRRIQVAHGCRRPDRNRASRRLHDRDGRYDDHQR